MLSGVDMVKGFVRSDVWKDLCTLLKEEISATQEDLETCGPGTGVPVEEFPYRIVHLQTKIMVLRDMLDLPQTLIEEAEMTSKRGVQDELSRDGEKSS